MDAEEKGFNAAICHYFLWRAASAQQTATQEAVFSSDNAAAPSETNGNRNSAASASRQSIDNNKENKGARYQQLAELMLQHFPMLRAPLVLLPIPSPTIKPQVLEQFSTFLTLHQEVLYLRSRCQALESQCYEFQKKLRKSNTNGKSKDPPAAAVNATANSRLVYTMATASTTSSTSAATKNPNDKLSKLASRSVVPDDVKEQINQLEHEKLNNKRTIDHLQNQVLQSMGTDTSKEAPPLPPPEPVMVQPNKKRRYIPKEKDLSWEEQLQQLEHFAKSNGHCRVLTEHSQLGTFVRELRRKYRKLQALDESKRNEILSRTPTRANHLSHQRLAKLNELGFEWRAAPTITSFEERIEQLVRYKEEHGDVMVPHRYKKFRGLGVFVQGMRKKYKQKHHWLMGEREEKLNALGFVWDTNTARKIPFKERLEECRAFREKHGHLNVPPLDKDEKSEISEEERSFRLWCNRARGYYRHFHANQQSRLDRGQIKKLDEMGFDWGPLTSVRKKKLNDKQDSVAPECEQVLEPANITSSSDESHSFG